MRRLDISMPLFDGMPAFPGDPPFASVPVRRLAAGDPYALSGLTLGSHAGTHLDPPRHFRPDGVSVDALDLDVLNGPCEVVDAGPSTEPVGPDRLGDVPAGTVRVLLRTPNSARWAQKLEFFEDYVGLSVEGAARLVERGVRLVGIDALSIERDPSDRFPVHRVLLDRGVVILEGLLLAGVRPGRYGLECLPLRIRDGDGAPARAVLVEEDRTARS
jgi:arylformamidase